MTMGLLANIAMKTKWFSIRLVNGWKTPTELVEMGSVHECKEGMDKVSPSVFAEGGFSRRVLEDQCQEECMILIYPS